MCHFDGCGYEESEKKKSCLIKSTFLRMSERPTDLVPTFQALSLISPISSTSPKAGDPLRHSGLLSHCVLFLYLEHLFFSSLLDQSWLFFKAQTSSPDRSRLSFLSIITIVLYHGNDSIWVGFHFWFPPFSGRDCGFSKYVPPRPSTESRIG